MPAKKNTPKKTAAKTTKSAAKPRKPVDKVPKSVVKASKPVAKEPKPIAKAPKPVAKEPKPVAQKPAPPKNESSLMIPGAKFLKVPFFADLKKDDSLGKQKLPEKPTACSRPKVNGALDSKNLVELLSQQLEFENRTYFEGCEGQICVKCNVNNVDQKYYVDKSLGYCTDCAMLLGLGQSKEGVFSDAQMELMRRSMEKSKDIESEDDIESALGEMDLELELEEEALLAGEEDIAEYNT